jgi:uncharacterized membrane protein HdeD (DUF308 family)
MKRILVQKLTGRPERWWLEFLPLNLGVLLGIVIWRRPGAGALALITLVAPFAIVTGVVRIWAEIHLRNRGKDVAAAIFPSSAEAWV